MSEETFIEACLTFIDLYFSALSSEPRLTESGKQVMSREGFALIHVDCYGNIALNNGMCN